MQFGIRDLLMATTIAAVYTAGYSYLLRLDGGSWRPNDLFGPLFMVAVMGATTLAMWRRSLSRLGNTLVEWRGRSWPQLFFLLFFFSYLAFCTWRGKFVGAFFPMYLAWQQMVFLFSGQIKLGDNGALLGMQFVPWSECQVRIDEDNCQLEYSQSGQIWLPRYPITELRIPIPVEKIEAIRQVLVEKETRSGS